MNSTKLLLNSKSQAQCVFFSRFYYTNRVNKATLYSRISPLGGPDKSVEAELENWLKHGKNVRVAELQRIIYDLRKRKRFTQALQVSEWMNKKESYFNGLKDQDKTDKTYGALLNCYVRQRQTNKSLSHLRKMKELGFASTALTYNDIMCLYTNIGQHEKVPEVMKEMKEKNVSPDNFSYRICINSFGVMSNLKGMEENLTEVENQPPIKMDWNTYAVVANFYVKAGLTEKAIDQLKKSKQKSTEVGFRVEECEETILEAFGLSDLSGRRAPSLAPSWEPPATVAALSSFERVSENSLSLYSSV
ncbi:pentatricopeptide repeat-containing protein At4g21705, mitochondrial-like [Hibiscus syriacus]|uniref:pentatricopeptide repeat-containing protein At4g21705, mitochondrial-like n=1 Tax=Hibiscus syriacus TaxID=106335 RepID=UPI001922F488|nr:pentatricopeptide repeat-containing protein At4g21705, mitochondrial-like [Hibiscus syriacus]